MSGEIDISIIIPAFNAQETLDRAINSSLRFEKFKPKIIVVNDGSKDSTYKVLNQYNKNNQLKIIDQPANKGVSNARNTGINASESEYILFLDADDYYLPDADIAIHEALTTNPSVDLFCFGYIINGQKSPRPKSERLNMEFLRAKFSNTNTIVVKRAALKEKRFDARYGIGEDTLFWFTLLSSVRAKFFDVEIAYYDYHPKINLAVNHPLSGLDLEKLGLPTSDREEVRGIVTTDQNRRAAFSRAISPTKALHLLGLKGVAFWILGPSNFARAWRINRYFRK